MPKEKLSTEEYIKRFSKGEEIPRELGNYYIVESPTCKILMQLDMHGINLIGIKFDSVCLITPPYININMNFPQYLLTGERGCLTEAKEIKSDRDRTLIKIIDRYLLCFDVGVLRKKVKQSAVVIPEKTLENDSLNWIEDCIIEQADYSENFFIYKPTVVEFPFLTDKEKLLLNHPPRFDNESSFYENSSDYISCLSSYLQIVRDIHKRFEIPWSERPRSGKNERVFHNKEGNFIEIDNKWHKIYMTGVWK